MKKFLSLALVSLSLAAAAQNDGLWKKVTTVSNKSVVEESKQLLKNPRLYSLDFDRLKITLQNAPKSTDQISSNVLVSFPDSDGNLEEFRIYEKSNFEPALQSAHPEIRSYVGESVFGSSRIYFSVSPLGLSTMEVEADRTMEIIEPYTKDLSAYAVFKRTDDNGIPKQFECKVPNVNGNNGNTAGKSADDGLLRTYRLALSCTGEYGTYFGGTKALALAGMNNTMTRVNGVFEKEFSIHLTLIADEDNIIFTNSSTDPYSAASTGAGGAWSDELKGVLMGTTYGIGDSKYDIGHLFGRSGGGGSAGCIGCVCNSTNTYNSTYQWYEHKGQGFTSPGSGAPVGDNFDIDYVAHEMGHQFGGWHTFTHGTEGNPSQMEPGSGSTIMGYAGITSKDVQPHSDPYFHAASIRDITNYMKSTAGNCSVNAPNANTAPTANAGADYTIPKSTPFMLTGSGADANGDSITYDWEQFDLQNASTTNPTATKTSGVNFRSYLPTTSPTRYFPKMTSVLAGSLFTAATELNVEYLPSVARTLNFRLTVRDNKTTGGANAYDDMKVTVNAASGPFKVTVPNTAVSYEGNSSQTVTWDVASTTASPVNCANVDILISTDGGTTWSPLATAVANDGSEVVMIPNVDTTTARIMVKANGNIFFDVSDANFTITKTQLAVTDVNKNSIQIFPNPVKEVLNVSNVSPNSNYEIFSAAGQLVSKGNLGTGKVAVNKLARGVYFLNVDDRGTVVKTKFVKE
jgi:hypothetical protein